MLSFHIWIRTTCFRANRRGCLIYATTMLTRATILKYGKWQKQRIRPGGLYIADNVLWHGRVAVEHYIDTIPGCTEAILEHNRLIFSDSDFDAFINPSRDGVIVARRKTV